MGSVEDISRWWVPWNAREGPCVVFEVVVVLPMENRRPWSRIDTLNILDEMHEAPLVQQPLPQLFHKGGFDVLFPGGSGR